MVAPLLMSLIRVRLETGIGMGNCGSLNTGTISTIKGYIEYPKQ